MDRISELSLSHSHLSDKLAMAFKFIAFAALVAAANAGVIAPAYQAYHAAPAVAHYAHAAPLAYAAPVAKAVVKTVDADYDPNPQYSYSYDVHDTLTGDAKSQHETRNGDVVEGSYSLVEADGTRRIVDYTADPHNGFNAVVRKEPATVAVKAVAHAPVAYHAAPAAHYAAPAVAHYAAPAAHYAAPAVAHYAAPAAHYAAPAVAHYAAPVAHASYAAPAYSYHH